MKKQILLTAFVVITTMLFNAMPTCATVWRVNNNPNYTQGCNHCFNDLQTANDTSIVQSGDTVHLEASNIPYTGPGAAGETAINKFLVIIGPGYFLSQNANLQKNPASATVERIKFEIGSDSSVLKGVRIFNVGGSDDLTIEVGNILVENCYINADIDFRQNNNVFNISIKKCFVNGRITGTNAFANVSNLIINNTYIGRSVFLNDASNTYSGEISHCVIVAGGGSISPIDIRSDIQSFHNNIITRNAGGLPLTLINQNDNGSNIHDNIFIDVLPPFPTGSNNISLTSAYVFTPTGSQDSILNVNPIVTCPECYTAFPGTETFGMFGGADPYKLSGIPNIPAIYQLQSPLSIIQGAPINVSISTRSND